MKLTGKNKRKVIYFFCEIKQTVNHLFCRMLDEYFAEQMKEIVRQCARNRQTMLFSATMTTAVEDLASVSLTNPVKIFVDSNQSVTFNLRQEFIR